MNELSSILKTREDEFSKKPTHIATSSLAERARQVAKLTAKYQSKFIDVCDVSDVHDMCKYCFI